MTRCEKWVALGWILSALVAATSVRAQTAPDLAEIFGLEGEKIEALLEESGGPQSTMTRLVIADFLGTTSPERAILELDKLAPESLRDPFAAAYANAIRCAALVRQARLEEGTLLCADAEQHLEAIEDPFLKARILASVQFLAVRQGRLRDALEYAFEAEHWAAATGQPYIDATALNGIALTLAFSGLHQKAIQRFEQARARLHDIENRPLHKMIVFNLGVSYMESGSPEMALDAFREGFEWAESTGQEHRAFIGRIEMANALAELERWQESIDLLEPALHDAGVERDPDSHMHALLAYSRAEMAIGNIDDALKTLSKGLELARQYQNTRRLRQLTLARIEGLGFANRVDQAIAEGQVLVAQLQDAQPNDELDDALDLLSRLQAKAGDYTDAYRNLVEARDLREASRGRSFARKLTLIEVADRLEFAERERQFAEERAQALGTIVRKNRQINLAVRIALILTAAAVFLTWRIRTHAAASAKHQRKSADLEGLVEQRNKALEDQMVHRMRGDEELRNLEEQLAETEKLRALGQLTGGIAHDFNNLMTVVSGAAELLESAPDMDREDRAELVGAIRKATDTGQKINAGLLAYAKRQKLTPEPINIEGYLSDSRPLFQGTVGEQMTLEINGLPLTIAADKGQLTTAIINLLLNARDASGSVGHVSIEVEHLEDEAAARLSVRDSGCGMTEEEAARATEPFYSTKETTLASGLGLSRVYGFVRQSGGQVTIDSKPGKGTVVSLVFPITEDSPVSSEPPFATSSQPLRVLLVDDNKEVRDMVKAMLENLGHEVDTAASGKVALEKLKQVVPDLLISDILMPGEIGGRELARAARNQHPQLPILMISGFAEAQGLDVPLLTKPFTLADLASAIGQLKV